MSSSDNSSTDARPWELPPVDSDEETTGRTNALNKPLYKWQFEPPETQEVDVEPLTAEQIEEIRQSAQNDGFESGREEGLAQGHKEGHEKGYQEGLLAGTEQAKKDAFEQASEEIKQHVSELKTLIDSLQTPVNMVSTELKKELTLLTVTLAKHVIQREISTDESLLTNAISKALSLLPIAENKVDIIVAPSQKAFVEQQLQALIDDQNNETLDVRLSTDTDITPGGCKVETKQNAVDLSIERRCEHVFSQILTPLEVKHDPRAD